MIKKINSSSFVVLLLLFTACKKEELNDPKPISTSINKILPLGASRVEGGRPEYESYRFELWKDLKSQNIVFDFIGTQSDDTSYPDYNGSKFDIDHEGRGGWTSGEILSGLESWLSQTAAPDIVLLSSPGGNDALQQLSYSQAVSNINAIIDILQSNNPNVTIIIEQMAPARSDAMTPELTLFLDQMQQEVLTIAANKSTTSSEILSVDMFTGFTDNHLADDVHYNESGAAFVAQRYFDILIDVLE
jgi:lysophospholipase L1-like esterase